MATEELVDRLRYESEGASLDFKAEQYRFVHGNLEDKAELLKDVLAFANSWRRSDAYILIGLRELKGDPAEVVGIDTHLDDSDLQEFVNGKTQRPIQFSYRELSVSGKTVAVIRIPVQERPFYLNTRFGKLKADVVYVRRGSSTAVAKPDEVAQMGREMAAANAASLDVFFAEPATRTRVVPSLRSHVLAVPESSQIPDYRRRGRGPFDAALGTQARPGYYRELAEYTRVTRLVSPLWLAIANNGEDVARDPRLELTIPDPANEILIVDTNAYPAVPESERLLYYSPLAAMRFDADVQARRVGDGWLVTANAAKVQAKSTEWFSSPFYLGAMSTQVVEAHVKVFADNLPSPHQQEFRVPVEATFESASLERILEMEEERLVRSEEHQAFLRRLEEEGRR